MHVYRQAPERGVPHGGTGSCLPRSPPSCSRRCSPARRPPRRRRSNAGTPITVNVIPIANTLPLDVGIKQGFFEKQGLDVKKVVLQSGNDIMLALANNQGQIGFAGWVPAMIGRTPGIPITAVATSEVEGTNAARQLAEHHGQGLELDPDAGRPRRQDDRRQRTEGRRRGDDPGGAREVRTSTRTRSSCSALPFPAMRSALANGQVDAAWMPEPFLSQVLSDGGRTVLAPGPCSGSTSRSAATSPGPIGSLRTPTPRRSSRRR